MFRRKNRANYYIQNNKTREQRCLGTSDKQVRVLRIHHRGGIRHHPPQDNQQVFGGFPSDTVSKFQCQTCDDTPMDFRACCIINWKYKAKSKTGLHLSNGFEVHAKSDASKKTVLTGVSLV